MFELARLDNRAPSASHIPRTLAQLQHKIQDYLSNNQRDPMARNFSMLLLTAQGVISQRQLVVDLFKSLTPTVH